MVQAYRTSSNLLEPQQRSSQKKQGVQGARTLVRGGSSVSNLLEPHHDRDSRVLSSEFRVVRLYRTFSNYIFTGETRCAGCSCTNSGWFKRIEPPRTFSNHIITEIARCVAFFHMSSGWFDYTFSNDIFPGETRVQGAYAL